MCCECHEQGDRLWRSLGEGLRYCAGLRFRCSVSDVDQVNIPARDVDVFGTMHVIPVTVAALQITSRSVMNELLVFISSGARSCDNQ